MADSPPAAPAKARPAWRRAAIGFVLFGGVGLVFLFGAGVLGLSGPDAARRWLAGAAHGPWALPAAVVCFAALAFLGVPQFVLIAAAVAAFGPWIGMTYSWVGTMVSALVGFGLARLWGGRMTAASLGATAGRLMTLIERNGFLASLVIRLVPFAPFVVVNMAAGLTSVRLLDFVAGTAIGILPKIALTAMAGHSVVSAATGGGWAAAIGLLIGAGGVWILATAGARYWMKREKR